MRHIGPVRSAAETAAWLERTLSHWSEHGFGNRAVILRAGGSFVGRCGLGWFHGRAAPELAYTLHANFWGMGLATEAAAATLRHGFEVLRLPRVVAAADRANAASRRVLEKLGMTYRED